MLTLLCNNLISQTLIELSAAGKRAPLLSPFFHISFVNPETLTDTTFFVAHVYHDGQRMFSLGLITAKADSTHIQTLVTGTKISDTTFIKNYPYGVDSAVWKSYRVTIVQSEDLDSEFPIIASKDFISVKPVQDSAVADTSSKKKKSPVNIHGSVTVIGQASDGKLLYQTVPQNYVRTFINTDIDAFGVPFNAGYVYTTENNSGLNRINNFSFSFNYEKFYNNLKQKLEAKMQAGVDDKRNRLSEMDMEKVRKEQIRLKTKMTTPDYQEQLNKNRQILDRGEKDSTFKKTYRYKRAQQQLLDHDAELERMKYLDDLQQIDLKNGRALNTDLNVNKHRLHTPSGFRRELKKQGLQQPGYDLLLSVKKFELGTFTPTYSQLVLNGVSVTGVNAEINPGQLYGAFTWGKTVANFYNPFAFDIAGGRTIMAGRAGIGRTEKLLVAATVLKGEDDSRNLVSDTNHTYYVPKNNYVTGLDLTYKSEYIDVALEYARALNREAADGEIKADQLLNDQKIKYSGAALASVGVNLKDAGTKFRLSGRLVDPYYYSFGTPFLRQDNFRLEGKADQTFLKKQITAGVSYRRDADNIYGLKQATSVNNGYIFTLNLKFKRYPFLLLSYSPNYQSFYSNVTRQHISSSVKLWQATTGYTVNGRNAVLTSTFSYLKQFSSSNAEGISSFHIDQYLLSESLMLLQSELQLNVSLSAIVPHGGDTGRTYMADVSAAKGLFKNKVTTTIGYIYQKDFSIQQRHILSVEAGWNLWWKIRCAARFERHFITSYRIENNKTDMHLGRLTIIKTF